MLEEVRNVLENEKFWTLGAQDLKNVEEKSALLGVLEPKLLTGLRERLTRKTRTKKVMIGNVFRGDRGDVPRWTNAVVLRVQILKLGHPLSGEHALSTEVLKCDVKAAKSREEVHELELARP